MQDLPLTEQNYEDHKIHYQTNGWVFQQGENLLFCLRAGHLLVDSNKAQKLTLSETPKHDVTCIF